jgi:hypothetical protein
MHPQHWHLANKGIKFHFYDSYFEDDSVHHHWERSQRPREITKVLLVPREVRHLPLPI